GAVVGDQSGYRDQHNEIHDPSRGPELRSKRPGLGKLRRTRCLGLLQRGIDLGCLVPGFQQLAAQRLGGVLGSVLAEEVFDLGVHRSAYLQSQLTDPDMNAGVDGSPGAPVGSEARPSNLTVPLSVFGATSTTSLVLKITPNDSGMPPSLVASRITEMLVLVAGTGLFGSSR